jgi:ABC-type multidrug transport system fused ATPase/permease subunit
LDKSGVAEVGSHEELMAKRGKYFTLFSTQAHRYTGIDYEETAED